MKVFQCPPAPLDQLVDVQIVCRLCALALSVSERRGSRLLGRSGPAAEARCKNGSSIEMTGFATEGPAPPRSHFWKVVVASQCVLRAVWARASTKASRNKTS